MLLFFLNGNLVYYIVEFDLKPKRLYSTFYKVFLPKGPRSETNKQTNKKTDRQTDIENYILDYLNE